MEYTAQVFYDVTRMDIGKLASYYDKFQIPSPKSEEELRTPFHENTAATRFEPISRSQVMELTDFVLGFSKCRMESGSLE
ncbi:hypothetical protein JW711_02095 [Candidatus Woesearchaeota archaeon]|nr:hypothetical protein [Candidatus Woesearchaeota archaeon]